MADSMGLAGERCPACRGGEREFRFPIILAARIDALPAA
jgi:hypothetical protein